MKTKREMYITFNIFHSYLSIKNSYLYRYKKVPKSLYLKLFSLYAYNIVSNFIES